jgi:hypothetical protein
MPRADFIEGALSTLTWSGWTGRAVRGDLTRADVDDASGFTQLRTEYFGFWSTHGNAIESASGVKRADGQSGLYRADVALNTSWQAGHDLALIRAGRKDAFEAAEWGLALAAAMNASAGSLGRCVVEIVGGVVTIVWGG